MLGIRATGWFGGSTRSPVYGLRIAAADRDRMFDPAWESVMLILPGGDGAGGGGEAVEAPLTPSFWRRCTEIRSAGIGRWLLAEGLAPWPHRQPPEFTLEPAGEARFRVRRL